MNIEDFYSFGSKLTSSTVQASPVGLQESTENPTNLRPRSEHRLILGDYTGISFPVVFKQAYGKKWQDILDTGWASLYLISDSMKSVLEDNNLTGWKSFAVNIVDKQGAAISGYHGFSVTGRCGLINYSKSAIIEKRVVPNGSPVKYYKGLHVGLDEWDGSDFFIPAETLWMIATKKVAEILQKSKLTNMRLENLSAIEIDQRILQTA